MKEIRVSATTEQLPVTIGGETFIIDVDLSEDTVAWVAGEAEKWKDAAICIRDAYADDSAGQPARLALLIQPLLWRTIGEGIYEELLRAYGKGRRVPPAKANMLMLPIWAEVVRAVGERMQENSDDGAAIKYLADLGR